MATEILRLDADQFNAQLNRAITRLDRLERELTQSNRTLARTERNARRAGDGISTMVVAGRVFVALALAQQLAGIATAFATTADEMTRFRNRIRLVTSDLDQQGFIFNALIQIALDTGATLDVVSSSFQRFNVGTESLGFSIQENIQLVRTLAQTFEISGSSTAEATSSALQFGQALSSGVLRGEELNAILESNPRLARAVADGLGVVVGDLRRLGAEGQLQSIAVARAVLSQADIIADTFAEIVPPIARSINNLNIAWIKFVDEFSESTGAGGALSDGITSLSENLEDVIKISAIAVAGLTGLFAPAIISGLGLLFVTLSTATGGIALATGLLAGLAAATIVYWDDVNEVVASAGRFFYNTLVVDIPVAYNEFGRFTDVFVAHTIEGFETIVNSILTLINDNLIVGLTDSINIIIEIFNDALDVYNAIPGLSDVDPLGLIQARDVTIELIGQTETLADRLREINDLRDERADFLESRLMTAEIEEVAGGETGGGIFTSTEEDNQRKLNDEKAAADAAYLKAQIEAHREYGESREEDARNEREILRQAGDLRTANPLFVGILEAFGADADTIVEHRKAIEGSIEAVEVLVSGLDQQSRALVAIGQNLGSGDYLTAGAQAFNEVRRQQAEALAEQISDLQEQSQAVKSFIGVLEAVTQSTIRNAASLDEYFNVQRDQINLTQAQARLSVLDAQIRANAANASADALDDFGDRLGDATQEVSDLISSQIALGNALQGAIADAENFQSSLQNFGKTPAQVRADQESAVISLEGQLLEDISDGTLDNLDLQDQYNTAVTELLETIREQEGLNSEAFLELQLTALDLSQRTQDILEEELQIVDENLQNLMDMNDTLSSLAADIVGPLESRLADLVDSIESLQEAQDASRRGSAAGAIIGGIAGFAFGGGPPGAVAGATIGGSIGGALGFQDGGLVPGNPSNVDNIFAGLATGEFVTQASSVNASTRPLLNQINRTGSAMIRIEGLPMVVSELRTLNNINTQQLTHLASIDGKMSTLVSSIPVITIPTASVDREILGAASA